MYQRYDFGIGGGGGAVALTLDRTFGSALAPLRAGHPSVAVSRRPRNPDLLVDLGVDIGSRRWWRGLASCTALCTAAAMLAPDMASIPGASPLPLADAQWDEARALAFAPLAYGADTGSRMAATTAVEPLEHSPERATIDLLATLGRGDSFARVLERSGVGAAEAAQVAAMVGAVASLSGINPGTPMDVTLGRRANRHAARPLERLAFRARFDLDLVVARSGGRLQVRPLPIVVDDTPLRIQGRVGSSLYLSARAAGIPAKAVGAYIRALSGQLSLDRDIGSDDRFDVIVAHRRTQSGEAESGQLLYAGLDRSQGKDFQLLQWTLGGRTQWFEASGVGKTTGSMSQPVAGTISSGFGMRRHPILGFSRMHRGIDFRAGYGQPIYAATEGRVTAAGWAGGYGRQVRIAHGGGLGTSYSHMSRIVAQSGATVRQGQVIGYVGSTGLSTGPHLHYELYKDGAAINPRSVRFVTRSLLEGGELEAFKARLNGLLAVRSGSRPVG